MASQASSGSSLGQRALAIVILAVAGWFLLKVVIGFVTAIATTLAVVLAIIAIVWAVRTL